MIASDLRGRLETERRELLERLARDDADLATPIDDKGEDTTPSQHPADVASDLLAREAAIMIELDQRQAVAEIDDALVRIRNGTYGVCVDCGRPISAERLEIQPQAARCIDCQRREERSR